MKTPDDSSCTIKIKKYLLTKTATPSCTYKLVTLLADVKMNRDCSGLAFLVVEGVVT